MEAKITLDYLYDLMRFYIVENQIRPKYLLINPKDAYDLKETYIEKFGYNFITGNDKMEFQDVKFIRSHDIKINKPIFVG